MRTSYKSYKSKSFPKKDVIDGNSEELVSENGIKTYVDDTTSSGGGGGVSDTDSVEWKKQQYFDSVSLTASGTTVAWDLESAQFAALTLAGNYTLSNPTNPPSSGRGNYILIVKQDSTGGRTLSFGSDYKFTDGVAPTLSTAASAVDVLTFVYDDVSSNMYGTAKLNLK